MDRIGCVCLRGGHWSWQVYTRANCNGLCLNKRNQLNPAKTYGYCTSSQSLLKQTAVKIQNFVWKLSEITLCLFSVQPLKSVFHGEKTVNFICCQWSTGICLTSGIYCSLQNTFFSMKTFSPFNFMLASWVSSPLPLGAQQLATQQIVQITDVTRCCHDASSLTVHGALRAMQLSVLPIIRSVLLQNSGCLLHFN